LQLSGKKEEEVADLAACEPLAYFGGDRSKIINPCGLIAWSNFNDTYLVSGEKGREGH
jgi:hypothetical protein